MTSLKNLPSFISITLLALIILASCQKQQGEKISKRADYDHFLSQNSVKTSSKYFELWNSKIKPDSIQLTSFGIVGAQYHSYFEVTGDIEYLKKAEQALLKAVEIAAIGKADYYRALSRNYISQHRFKEALQMAEAARNIGSGLQESRALLFDVHLELGNYGKAEAYLDSLKNMSDFGYLIRLAKWNDYKGDLDTTIRLMEKAMSRAEEAANQSLMLWSYTNLADYYGHAGRIEDSYNFYLKALHLQPTSAYAKKGIAWIVFSYEKNPAEARRILDSITEYNQSPDYYLFKAEIAEYQGDEQEYHFNLDKYMSAVRNPSYGEMYNAYNIGLYLDQTGQYRRALALALREVDNRSTPETYSMLAYAYYKLGQTDKALELVREQVEDRTSEPAVLLQIAEIYKAGGHPEETNILKEELLGALYELGPGAESKIRKL